MATVAMMMLLVGANVGVHLSRASDTAPDVAAALMGELKKAIAERSGLGVTADDPVWSGCGGESECLSQVKARTASDQIILVSAFGALTRLRVVAERIREPGQVMRRAQVDLPLERSKWSPGIEEIARTLFPERRIIPAEDPHAASSVAPAEGPRLLPWVVLGLSAASFATGAALGLSSASSRDRIESEPTSDTEYEDLVERVRTHGRAADVLFGVSVAALVGGVALLLVD